jgi:hypothetical protein
MAYLPPATSAKPIQHAGTDSPPASPSPRAKRTLSAQPAPKPRIVPKIQLSPRIAATKVEATSSAPNSPQQQAIIDRLTPRVVGNPPTGVAKGEDTPRKKSKKHTRQSTFDSATLHSAPTSRKHRSGRSTDDKQTLGEKLEPTASKSARTSPRFVVTPRRSPKTSPRFVIGAKQPVSSPSLPAIPPGSPSEKPAPAPIQFTPDKPSNVQRQRAFFEGLAESDHHKPPALKRTATAQSRSAVISKLTQSAGLPEKRATKPDVHS